MHPKVPTLDCERLGNHLAHSRVEAGLSQAALAARSGLAQQQVSLFEAGLRIPTLPQALRIARTLDIPIQRLLTGSDGPGAGPADLAIELRRLGVIDLRVGDSAVPGSFRRPEEVINLAIAGESPDPRIVEAIPATLAWNELDPDLLVGHSKAAGMTRRLAWLADIALAIDRQSGFPGGCRKGPLERFLLQAKLPGASEPWEDLGKPATERSTSPLWRRWRIAYDADLSQFRQRAEHLQSLRIGSATRPAWLRGRVIVTVPQGSDPAGYPLSPPPVKPRSPKKVAFKRTTAVRRRRRPDDQ
ncbi:helix-turn-helix transcriptional regulator (plasmid) [Singulisphaera sp. Ch08]|uniref:Helix-turn-helix transcriptional regulator n=1 Tax=Singulisphaera sp. Ch08 TaxID=3120278 RepID=A0AAU7CU16_9BACT